jgi:membrane protein DedA with SNARE-associated domain
LLLSAQLAYQLSLRFGRPFAARLAGEENLDAAAAWIFRAGGACVSISRCLPVLSEAIACLAGITRFPPLDFFAASLLGALPAGFAFAYIGHLGREDSWAATALSAVLPVLLWCSYRRLAGTDVPKNSERNSPGRPRTADPHL